MRRIVNVTHISLDGVMERRPDWHEEYLSAPAVHDHLEEVLASCDALLLGRRTYRQLAAERSHRTREAAAAFDRMTTYVVSRTLGAVPTARTEVLSGDLVEELARVRSGPGGALLTLGFGRLVAALVEADLLDEIHVAVHPVLAGRAEPADSLGREGVFARLRLSDVRPCDSGVVVLTYRPAALLLT